MKQTYFVHYPCSLQTSLMDDTWTDSLAYAYTIYSQVLHKSCRPFLNTFAHESITKTGLLCKTVLHHALGRLHFQAIFQVCIHVFTPIWCIRVSWNKGFYICLHGIKELQVTRLKLSPCKVGSVSCNAVLLIKHQRCQGEKTCLKTGERKKCRGVKGGNDGCLTCN